MVITREQRKIARQEDLKCLLEEVSDCKPDSPFAAIVRRESAGGIQELIYLQKSELELLSYRQDDGNVIKFRCGEIDRIRTLNHYLKHLQDEGKFPKDKESFRFNSISRTDCNNFRFHPTNISLISSTGDLTVSSPPSFLSPSTVPSTATCAPAECFKKSIWEVLGQLEKEHISHDTRARY